MKKIILLLSIVMLPFITLAQKNHVDLLDQYMKAQASVHDFSGAVLVAKKGDVIYQSASGIANREWNIPNTTDTKYPISSLTKQFTAVAILQLVEQGKLQLEDKLSKYFPDYPKGDSITIHMLLNHTSGIKEYSENPVLFEINPNIPIEALKDTLIDTFKDQPFDFSPGTFWKYSNSGYILLGYIIEQVSGETYRNYIEKSLLEKASMKNSGLLRQDAIITNRAEGYSRTPEGSKKAMVIPINTSFSAGGLFSTVGDLFNWKAALNSGKLITQKSLARMNRPNQGDFGAGYGVFVDKIFNRRAIHHQGGAPGFNSFMVEYPEEEVLIIILTNRDTNLDFIPKGLAGILFDKEVIPTYERTPVSIAPALLKRYTGNFENPALPFPLNVIEKDGKLYLSLHRDIKLVPESDTKFYIDEPDVEIQIEYVLNDRKEITRLYFIEGGVKTEVLSN